MTWELAWGPSLKFLQDIARSTGTTPKSLKDRPLLGEAEHFYVACFYELNAFRGTGMSHQPLSVSDIKAYMDILGGFTPAQSLRFLNVIKELDKAYTNHKIEKAA